MYTIRFAGSFKQSFKRCKKRGFDMRLLEEAVEILRQTGTLPPSYRPHKLLVVGVDIGKRICCPTGFSSGNSMIKNFSL